MRIFALLTLSTISLVCLSSCKLRRTAIKSKPKVIIQQSAKNDLPDNDNLLLGMPAIASSDTLESEHYLINQIFYSISYNAKEGKPNWVCWHLNKSDLGTTGRVGKFHSDTSLPARFYRVKPSDYIKTGYDRGHNCPSGDRTSSIKANTSTFLMSNMIPQAPKNNRQTWAHLEEYIRSLISQGNEAYIIMGSYGSITGSSKDTNTEIAGDTKTEIAGGRVHIPSHIWKVALILPDGNGDLARIDTATRIIAVDTPNTVNIESDWKPYITTIKKIDSSGGYQLLNKIPENIRRVLDLKKDRGF